MNEPSCFAEIVGMLSDVAVGMAAVVAAYVAWRGLKTWKEQLSGTSEYELARRVLRALYTHRNAINGVRHPFMSVEEMPEPEDAGEMSREQVRHHGIAKAYQARWDRVMAARRELDAELLEAEVLWGAELGSRFKAIDALERELFVAVGTHVQQNEPALHARRREALGRRAATRRDVLFGNFDDGPDPYLSEYVAAVRAIEDYLRPHLRRK